MKKLSLLIFFFATILFTGCEKDIIGESEEPITIPTEPTELKLGDISGLVFDENNEPIENAIIEYSRESYSTDINGYFKIAETFIPSDGGLIKINKNGFFESFKYIFLETQQTSHIRIQLIEKNDPQTINGVAGGVVQIEGGAKIIFPERSLVDENNVSFEGEATIYTHWYDPTADNLGISMPGDLRAVSHEGELVQLSTFGMMAVEIFSSNGQKLNLADGITATLEFPLPEPLVNNAPSEIPTWSLDEETGVWIEESIAFLDEGKYIAEASHFSFWNCDIPANVIKLRGQVVNQDGTPLPWYQILITVKNSGVCGSGYTNSEGVFCGFVPKNSDLIIQVKDECGGIIFENEIGPFGVDTDLGELEIGSSMSQTTVKGSLRCEGQPIPNGYAKITLPNGIIYIGETDENGEYNVILEACNLNQLTVQGIDIENNRTSGIVDVTLTNNSGVIEIVPFEVCQDLNEFIRFKLNGSNEFLILDPNARIIDDRLEIDGQGQAQGLSGSINLTTHSEIKIGDNGIEQISSILIDGGNTLFGRCGDEFSINCENTNLNLTLLEGLGEFVEGTFMGEIVDSTNQSVTIMGNFRIMVDLIAETNAVSGVVWSDENEDGIRQIDEPLLGGRRIIMRNTQNDIIAIATTNQDGEYSFDRIFESEIILEIEIEPGFMVSIANQGTDDSIDSDFENNPHQISFANGEKLTNFDAGIHSDGELICFVELLELPICPSNDPFAVVRIDIERGTPPFTVFFDGDEVAQSNERSFEIPEINVFPPSGSGYSYEITDASGNNCLGEFEIEIIDIFSCIIESTNSTMGLNNGTAEAFALGTPDLIASAVWSTGETTININNLAPDTYSVTVTSIDGCTSECSITIEEEGFSCDIVGPDFNCIPGLGVDLIVETNQSDVTYLWSTSETTQFIVPTIDQATTFSVTVTNINGATTTCEKTIEVGEEIFCTVDQTTLDCNSGSGQLTVNASGGTPPYLYLWSNGVQSTESNIEVFQEGVYTVTVTDSYGCISSCSGTVVSQQSITCNINVSVGDCGTNDSSAIVEVFDGSGNYSYLWSNGAITQEIFNLASAFYIVTVTDEDTGCSTICETQIIGSTPLEAQIEFEQNCDEPDYFTNILVQANGGSGSYTYSWSNGNTDSEIEVETLGLFRVTVTDDQGCSTMAEIDLIPSASKIGNFVWLDDENGQQDIFDQGIDIGIPNVVLLLLSSDVNGLLTAIDSTSTNDSGFYEFRNIPEGSYVVSIEVPDNMQLVVPNTGLDINLDSDFDPMTAQSAVLLLDGCEINNTIDAGLKQN